MSRRWRRMWGRPCRDYWHNGPIFTIVCSRSSYADSECLFRRVFGNRRKFHTIFVLSTRYSYRLNGIEKKNLTYEISIFPSLLSVLLGNNTSLLRVCHLCLNENDVITELMGTRISLQVFYSLKSCILLGLKWTTYYVCFIITCFVFSNCVV